MIAIAQKFAPPAVVLGAALYLGMPPAAPLDLGESIVRASAVRWKKDDLKPPVITKPAANPFHEVLVASEEMEVEPDTGKLVVATKPSGPDPAKVRAGLSLSGIASMGGRKWAVINGKPRLPGDTLKTNDANHLLCKIVRIENDHAVIACEETIVEIRAQPFGASSSAAGPPVATPVSNRSDSSSLPVIAPPPSST
ncbi:hypothetical protein [Planctomycetes bacterium K23_9]|uniref:Uncharacterized protein n=1 Tax=Stieleria marina TaxID=1930275 RepID=A0A517P1T8_9BACT|nr:hypothetical protein K239x_53430 [Planctomycetes bacterium K23_9]